ncbi:MAG: malto-oligosyltrehalose synthase [Casimicrobiaceae bacterium]
MKEGTIGRPSPPTRHGKRTQRAADAELSLTAIPRATYRLQLHREFRFADVTALVPYLAALGISHVYCSPYLRARPGSRHGYDIIDHRMLNPEIGSREDFDRMIQALSRHGMSHLCDVVPNHMAVMGSDNAWWMDVLENGPASAYAEFFDINWSPQDPDLAGKVLVPVLGDLYGSVLERGELALDFEVLTGTFAVRYFEHRFPLDPRTFPLILAPALANAREGLDPETVAEVEHLVDELRTLPERIARTQAHAAKRRVAASQLKERLALLAARHPGFALSITRVVASMNGAVGEPSSFDALHTVLDAQPFRLANWRVASDEINYRRFFDINGLAALRMENEAAFDATHAFILGLAVDGLVGGLRIDHPDGLFDPARYFERLQDVYRKRLRERHPAASESVPEIYVALEKITAPYEHLPESWPVHGTTGYRFANVLNGLFVDTRARMRVDRVWRAFVGGEAHAFEEAAHHGRVTIMEGALASELAMLTLRARRIARADRRTRDFTLNALREAIKEIVACFPVYRTYVDARGCSVQDRRYVEWAIARARARSRVTDARIFAFLHGVLLGEPPEGTTPDRADRYRQFAMRFQQFTAPVAAKGVEDTAFYTFNRLVSLNDVGGDPAQFGMTVRAFHGASADRALTWPHTMLATSTHDNKRSEDVRARIDVISEVPAAWRLTVRHWSRINRSRKSVSGGQVAPSRNDEYLLYQTLIGSFPSACPDGPPLEKYRKRIERYMIKATREAKVHTSWFSPNERYEAALTGFVAALLRGSADNLFLADLRAKSATFAWFGMLNSVSMALIKMTSPGVPDIYQGNEIVDLSLVDPDNRRPVDYPLRQAQLASLEALAEAPWQKRRRLLHELFTPPYDGRAKLWVIARALALRRERPALFTCGDYRRVAVTGARAEHIVAFARRHGGEGMVVIAGRLFASLGTAAGLLPTGELWGDTTLDLAFLAPETPVANVLTGETTTAAQHAGRTAGWCADFPAALLSFPVQG